MRQLRGRPSAVSVFSKALLCIVLEIFLEPPNPCDLLGGMGIVGSAVNLKSFHLPSDLKSGRVGDENLMGYPARIRGQVLAFCFLA